MGTTEPTGYRDPAEVRRRKILTIATRNGFVRQAEIAAELDVSTETVRRDLAALQKVGELTRIHGGAVVGGRASLVEPAREERSSASTAQKEQIATVAVSLLDPDDIVFIDVGTTAEAVARALPMTFRGAVVTSSLPVALIVGAREDLELHLLGGRVRPRELTTYGAETVAHIRSFNATVAFLGAGGVTAAGISDYFGEDVAVKQAMIGQTARTFVVAGSDKFGRSAPRNVCLLDDLEAVITDAGVSEDHRVAVNGAGGVILTP